MSRIELDITWERVPCDLCGRDETDAIYPGARDHLHHLPGNFTFVRCIHCGLVYLNPRPDPQSLAPFYPDDYISYGACLDMGDRKLSRREKRVAGITLFEDLRRMRIIETVVSLHRGMDVLDVGCGCGSLLSTLHRKKGVIPWGVDCSEEAVRYAGDVLHLKVSRGEAERLPFDDESFDLVTMWHLLEHSRSPSRVCDEALRVLRPGGSLVVELPDFSSLERKIFGKIWFSLDAPRHLYHFTPATLSALFLRTGFQDERIRYRYTGLLFSSILLLLRVNALKHFTSPPFLLMNLIVSPLEVLFVRLNRGGVMTSLARKPGGTSDCVETKQ